MILSNHSQNVKSFVCISFLGFDWFTYTYFILVNFEKPLSAEQIATGIVNHINL